MIKLAYTGQIRSIPWQLMLWLLVSPGQQQPWYWTCSINRSLSYIRQDFNYLHNTVFRNHRTYKNIFVFPKTKSAGQELNKPIYFPCSQRAPLPLDLDDEAEIEVYKPQFGTRFILGCEHLRFRLQADLSEDLNKERLSNVSVFIYFLFLSIDI